MIDLIGQAVWSIDLYLNCYCYFFEKIQAHLSIFVYFEIYFSFHISLG